MHLLHVLNRRKLTNEKWLNLYEATYKNRFGKESTWTYASRKEPGNNKIDAVVVIPIYQGELVVINEYRAPIDKWEFSFPAGLVDNNEDVVSAARRELKEETGLVLTKVLYQSPVTYSSAGLTDESIVYVVCECDGIISTDEQEELENIAVTTLDIDDLRFLVNYKTAVISAKALPFMLTFVCRGCIMWPEIRETR